MPGNGYAGEPAYFNGAQLQQRQKPKRRRALPRQRESQTHGYRQRAFRDRFLRRSRKKSKTQDRFGGKRERLDPLNFSAVELLLQSLQKTKPTPVTPQPH